MTLLSLTVLLASNAALAGDRADAPGTTADPVADIGGVYAWSTGDKLVAALTFSGGLAAGEAVAWDADVLYTVHLDKDNDQVSDVDILVRFGQNGAGEWGVQVQNLPGTTAPVVGAVDTVLSAEGQSVFAGTVDDPFFADQAGLVQTLMTGTLSFTGADAFAGLNTGAVVLSMDLAAATNPSTPVSVWATSGRL